MADVHTLIDRNVEFANSFELWIGILLLLVGLILQGKVLKDEPRRIDFLKRGLEPADLCLGGVAGADRLASL